MNYLQKLQEKLGLIPDGIVGPKTADAIMRRFGIKDKACFTHWLAQVQHESANFTAGRENLNYSSDGLLRTFKKYYIGHIGLAEKHARKPELIANYVYANRMGNGDVESGDGYRYRGGGALQLTGKANYLAYFRFAGLPLDTNPDVITEPEHYFKSAVWFFNINNVWKNCGSVDKTCCTMVSKHINMGNPKASGTPIGLFDRLSLTEKIARSLGL